MNRVPDFDHAEPGLEQHLRRELGQRAGQAGVSVDPAALAGLGRREQRLRRTVAAVGAGVLTAAVVGGVALAGNLADRSATPPPATQITERAPIAVPTAQPTSMADLPVGPGSEVPWWSDGVLHVGDIEIETPHRSIVQAADTVLVGSTSADGSEWLRLVDDRLVTFRTFEIGLVPQLSANGRTALFAAPDQGGAQVGLTLVDVATGTDLDHVRIEVDAECCDNVEVYGVLNDGRALYRNLDEIFVWEADRDPQRVDIEPWGLGGLGGIWPDGVVRMGKAGQNGANPGILATVAADGTVTDVGRVEDPVLGLWSPLAATYVFLADRNGESDMVNHPGYLWAHRLADDSLTRLQLPDPPPMTKESGGQNWMPLGWEDETHVIVRLPEQLGSEQPVWSYWLARCDVTTGGCELAGDMPTGPAEIGEGLG